MNYKFSLICVLIFVLIFTSCSKKSETQSQTAAAEHTQITETADPYQKILTGDLSAFAGTWVNARGEIKQLRANGTLNAGETAYEFKIGNENDQHIAGTYYQWIVNMGGEAGGFEVWLFPAGSAIRNYDGDFIETDNSKVRIVIELIGSSAEIYYREGEAPIQTASNIPSDIAEIIHKRIEAIENGDIAAFRATLAPYEDSSDYNFQFRILAAFFGDLFGINADTAIEALANGDDVSEYARFLFNEVHRPVSRNTGLRITKIEINETYGYNVTVVDNKMQEKIISFMFSSF